MVSLYATAIIKDTMFKKMNDMRGKIQKRLPYKTTTVHLNDKFEFELIPAPDEEIRLRTALNRPSL